MTNADRMSSIVSDEECAIEGLRALVRIIAQEILKEFPIGVNDQRSEDKPVSHAPRESYQALNSPRLITALLLREMLSSITRTS